MNDRFKFRFWREHYDGNFTLECADLMSIDGSADPYNVGEGDVYCYYPGETIIEQCTGLKDKNGKLIFEGDILDAPFENFDGKSFDMRNLLCVVVYFNGSFMLRDKVGNYRYFDETEFAILDKELFAAEVVGNIHENPELLK